MISVSFISSHCSCYHLSIVLENYLSALLFSLITLCFLCFWFLLLPLFSSLFFRIDSPFYKLLEASFLVTVFKAKHCFKFIQVLTLCIMIILCKIFLSSFVISSLKNKLFSTILFNFQRVGHDLVFILLLTSNGYSESLYIRVSLVLWLILLSVLVNVTRASQRNVYSVMLG